MKLDINTWPTEKFPTKINGFMGTLSTTWGFPWISHMLGSVRWPIGRTSPQWISNPFGCCCWSSDAKLGFVEELNPERGQASMLAEPMVVSKSLASFGSILRLNTKQPSNYLWKLYSWKNSSCSKPKSTNHSINHLGLMLNSPMSRGIPNVTKFKFGDFFHPSTISWFYYANQIQWISHK